ncbi:hypothetical protein [Streptomyces sp. WAC01526]|nr:hypothetical protein [Streptomyces sp. WAC01526]
MRTDFLSLLGTGAEARGQRLVGSSARRLGGSWSSVEAAHTTRPGTATTV